MTASFWGWGTLALSNMRRKVWLEENPIPLKESEVRSDQGEWKNDRHRRLHALIQLLRHAARRR